MMKRRIAHRILVILGAYPDIGKGILTASCGYILQQQGVGVLPLKFDGYLNYNSGSMNPYHKLMDVLYEEEEVFVLGDGFETDADSGYYERFLGMELPAEHNLTNGQLFAKLLSDEHTGKLPPGEILKFKHVRDLAVQWITSHTSRTDVVVLEIGGTVGDPESAVLYDALRLMRYGADVKIAVILLTPYFHPMDGEGLAKSSRTKLARQAFERAAQAGLRPDLLALRCINPTIVSLSDWEFIASDCGIQTHNIFVIPDCSPVYELPTRLVEQRVHRQLTELLSLRLTARDTNLLGRLETYCSLERAGRDGPLIRIGIFGKTVSQDSFVSLREAVEHAAVAQEYRADLVWIDDLVNIPSQMAGVLHSLDGLIVAEGLTYWREKIAALNFARTHSLPTLCISLGFDLAAVELARNVCGCADAFLEELEEGDSQVRVQLAPFFAGSHNIKLMEDSLLAKLYGKDRIAERHRHQSWLSRELVDQLVTAGVLDSGYSDNGNLEVFDWPVHPFYIAMKAHPEFKSWPGRPSPPFVGLIQAAKQCQRSRV